jgi:hypothetical protein
MPSYGPIIWTPHGPYLKNLHVLMFIVLKDR